jgi:multiple sugar transport system substrate-binding protein
MRSARTFLTGLVILIVVVVAVGVPALTASVSAQEQVTLRFANWVSAEEASRAKVETVIAAFEAENPNIKIENIPIPFDQVRQQLITMSAGGNPPDIMLLNGAWPFELGGMGPTTGKAASRPVRMKVSCTPSRRA